MKKTLLFLFGLSAIFTSCSKDEEVLIADFNVVVTGKSPNAEVSLENKSLLGTTYEWTFSEGASITASKEQTPAKLKVDKAGDFTITLKVSNGSETKEVTKTVKVEGVNGFASFKNIELSQVVGSTTLGRCLSTKTGKVYKDSETKTASADIDLVYYGSESSFIYFEGPNKAEKLSFTNPKKTLVQNYKSRFEVAKFDALADDAALKSFNVIDDESVIGTLDFPTTVSFKTAEGKVGVIKLVAINSDRLLIDMKVQKY
jgi:PKD repeat protein